MTNLLVLIPIALGLGVLALAAFLRAYRSGQFDDLEGDGLRLLTDGEPAPPGLGDLQRATASVELPSVAALQSQGTPP